MRGGSAPKNRRCAENESLLKEIIRIHEESRGTYGTRKITHEINRKSEKPVNHKRIERIMRENGIQSKSHRKYKATTNSGHNLPVAENILNRNFTADRPGQKMVSDIDQSPTDEGWLYLAGVMDLCGDKIVGISMDGRMTKELVISALKDAISHTKLQPDVSCIPTGEVSTVHRNIRSLPKPMVLSVA